MDYDTVMLYVKNNPDCTSLNISSEFNVTVAKAFTFMNTMVEKGLIFKTSVRSPTNNKRIYSYRAIPTFDEHLDNGDRTMRIGEITRVLRRVGARAEIEVFMMHLNAFNDWRRANGFPLIQVKDVLHV
jgi:hypothetical protein